MNMAQQGPLFKDIQNCIQGVHYIGFSHDAMAGEQNHF